MADTAITYNNAGIVEAIKRQSGSTKFYKPNYQGIIEAIGDLSISGGDDGTGVTTATLPLADPSREAETRVDSTGLQTQADLNKYFDAYIKEVENGWNEESDSLGQLIAFETSARQQGDAANKIDIDSNTESIGNLTITVGLQGSKIQALELASGSADVQLTGETNTSRYTISVNGDAEKGCIIPLASRYVAGLMSGDDRKHIETWDPENYYDKTTIDEKFAVQGIGGTWLLSSFDGTITIRKGEFHTNNRLVGQITAISIAPESEDGKTRRDPKSGWIIELHDMVTQKIYQYKVIGDLGGAYTCEYVGDTADQNDPLGIGNPFTIYTYPTPYEPSDIYTIEQSDAAYVRLAIANPSKDQSIMENTKYRGPTTSNYNLVNVEYVSNAIASVQSAFIETLEEKVAALEARIAALES